MNILLTSSLIFAANENVFETSCVILFKYMLCVAVLCLVEVIWHRIFIGFTKRYCRHLLRYRLGVD